MRIDFVRDRAYRLFALIFPGTKPREANLDSAMLTFEKHNRNVQEIISLQLHPIVASHLSFKGDGIHGFTETRSISLRAVRVPVLRRALASPSPGAALG